MNGDQKPQASDNPPSLSEPAQRNPEVPPPVTQKPPEPVVAAPVVPAVPATPTESPQAAASFYRPEDDQPPVAHTIAVPGAAEKDPNNAVEWTASGEDLRSETAAWRLRMTIVSLFASGVIYLISRDMISAGSVAVVGLLFAFLGSRKPPSLQYRVDRSGITIGQKHYAYSEFRAFSLVDDMRSPSITVVPLKRFLPMMSIHYDSQQRDKIVEILADHLPLEIHRRDAFDSIINRVKF